MIKLGISAFYHDSAACITNGNLVLAAAEEERFTGIKHDSSFPINAIKWLLRSTVTDISQIQEIHWYENPETKDDRVKTIFNKRPIRTFFLRQRYKKDRKNNSPENLLKNLGYTGKIIYHDHHHSHSAFSYYTSPYRDAAILTVDGVGEWETTTISKGEGKKIKKLTSIDFPNSLGMLYSTITSYLGFKPNEGEYKVMGLAPYAKNEYSIRLYNDVFKNILKVKNCKVIHKQRPKNLFNYLLDRTNKYRFDNIAGAVQILVEKISSELINQISKKYKINTFSISGGVSMNIKMNKRLVSEKCAKKIYVAPTGTDESLSIGACYFLNKYKNKYLKNIYLGQAISEETLTKTKLRRVLNKNFIIKTKVSHKEIAKLLKSGEIVAVARGREEFGARALGNRSILANPSVNGIVQKINEQIKNRDFWMPFALTIQHEKHKEFIMNKKSIDCDFMTIGFDTVKKNYNKIKNGTHPYDKSVRPQILKKDFNKNYHSIIEEFRKLTKIPALLNTSLNLHGMPISSQIDDILNTFKNSDLQYLYLEDDILIKKS